MKRFFSVVALLALVPGITAFAAPPPGKGGGDKKAPSVTMASPVGGTEVTGSVSISAQASDNVGVDSVSYQVDGGSETSMTNTSGSTWDGTWDSSSATDGTHTITVTARDAAGNASSDSVSVTTNNGTAPVWPNSQGAIGDSITRAVFADSSFGGFLGGQPEHSWATGNAGSDGINSHYERLVSQNAAIVGNSFNNAVSGAVMSDFVAQANDTIADAPEYVTVFLGHNDLCQFDVSQIPSEAVFESQFRSGLDTLLAGLPDANVLVLEIIDVVQLYDCCSDDFGCQLAWAVYGTCRTVTASDRKTRKKVRSTTIAFNDILRSVCAEKGVAFEDDIYETRFARTDVSYTDCFHPGLSGQAMIAEAAWDPARF